MQDKENIEKTIFDEAYQSFQACQDLYHYYVESAAKMRFRYLCRVLIVSSLSLLSEFMGVKMGGIFPIVPNYLKCLFPALGIALAITFYHRMKIEVNRQNRANRDRLMRLELLNKINAKYNFTEYIKEEDKKGFIKIDGHLLNILYCIVEVLWCIFCLVVLLTNAIGK